LAWSRVRYICQITSQQNNINVENSELSKKEVVKSSLGSNVRKVASRQANK